MATVGYNPAADTLYRQRALADRLDLPRRLTFLGAAVVVLLVGLILGFIFWNGIQVFIRAGYNLGIIASTEWAPAANPPQFGLLPFIAGTIAVTVVAAIISTPLSVGLAIFMSEIAPRWAKSIAQPAMEVFVGIPSVVWGWLGITILVPWLRENLAWAGFNVGFSWFAGSSFCR